MYRSIPGPGRLQGEDQRGDEGPSGQECQNTIMLPFTGEISYRCFRGCQKYFWRPLKSPHESSPVNQHSGYFGPPDLQEIKEQLLERMNAKRGRGRKCEVHLEHFKEAYQVLPSEFHFFFTAVQNHGSGGEKDPILLLTREISYRCFEGRQKCFSRPVNFPLP